MADYYTLLTNAGIAYEVACKAAGAPIKLTEMSVGDGNGAVYNPAATATALKREVWRGPLNALFQDENNPSWLLAEVTIPPEVGGWYVREAGLWTDTGILYAIVKYPESFKPILASSGSGKEFYIRSIFETSNAASVALSIDDTIVKATRAWVATYVADEIAKLDRKQSVRAATTANIALSGAQTIDGVAVVAGDRVLVKNQAQGKENGVYVAAIGAWTRAKDADNSAKVTPNMMVAVEVGATQADTIWQLITDGVIVVGATALVFQDVTAGFARLLSPSFVGNPTAPTPLQFDNSKSVATTEFVKRSGVEYSGFTTNAASLALTSVHVGGLHSFSNAAQLTATLPPTVGVAQGATIALACAGAGGLSVVAAAGDVVYTSTGVAGPVLMALGDTAEFIRLQDQWRLIGGTVALRYAGVMAGENFATRPQFDNTKALASTEFVNNFGLQFGPRTRYYNSAAQLVLTPSDVGSMISFNGGSSQTAKLPPTASLPIGATIRFVRSFVATGILATISSDDGSAKIDAQSSALVAAFNLQGGEDVSATWSGSAWILSGAYTFRTGQMAASLVSGGYQKLPSGLIMQWGVKAAAAVAGNNAVVFPIAFPNECFGVTLGFWLTSTANYYMTGVNSQTKNGFNIYNPQAATLVHNWLAIGY